MASRNTTAKWVVICGAVLFWAASGYALITGEHGNRPVENRGWPDGSVEVANLPSRLGYWEGPPFGGGEYCFLYRCQDRRCRNSEEFNEALKIFASMKAQRLELVVHNGPEYSSWLKDSQEKLEEPNNRVDWTFTVWTAQSWNHLYNDPCSYMISADHPNFKKPVAAPRIDVYIGGGGEVILADVKVPKTIALQALQHVEGPIVWAEVKVPKGVVVIDKRPGSISPQFADAGLVRAKVFDMITKKPIAGVQVAIGKYEDRHWKELMLGTTDQRGFCQIEKTPLGYYEIRIKADGYVTRKQGSYDNKRPEYLTFETGLTRPESVSGIVVDQQGNPIEGITVSATNIIGPDGLGYPCVDNPSATTDAQGRFTIWPLPKGLMSIRCQRKSLHLQNSIFEQYQIPSKDVKLTMTGTATVRGRVVGKDGKKPAGQIVLELHPPGGPAAGKWAYSGYVGEDGAFEITGVPSGRYVVTTRPNPSRGMYKPSTQEITVEAGEEYDIEIVFAEPQKR